MNSTGYKILDVAIEKIKESKNYSIAFSQKELMQLVKNEGELFEQIRILSKELISFQIKMEGEEPPVRNLVKSCSYNERLEVTFDEEAMDVLIASLK